MTFTQKLIFSALCGLSISCAVHASELERIEIDDPEALNLRNAAHLLEQAVSELQFLASRMRQETDPSSDLLKDFRRKLTINRKNTTNSFSFINPFEK